MDDNDPRKADADDVDEARVEIGDVGVDKDDDAVVQFEVQTALTTLAQFRGGVGRFLDNRRLDGVITDMRTLLLTSPPALMAKSRVGVYDTVWERLLTASAVTTLPHSPSKSDLSTPIRNAWRYSVLLDIADRSRLLAALAVALGPGSEVGWAFVSATHHAMTLVW